MSTDPAEVARLHDDEVGTGPGVVRALLAAQQPRLAHLPLSPLAGTGTDNVLHRLGGSLLVRLPRNAGAARSMAAETAWLPRLDGCLPVAVPTLVHAGAPAAGYPFPWSVLGWLEGADAWAARGQPDGAGVALGRDLARLVAALRALPVEDARPREPGGRGAGLADLDERVRWWLGQAAGLVDVAAVTRVWDRCREVPAYEGAPVLAHGDLIPGNLLLDGGRLTAVLGWGGIGAGDPAQDLDPAWSVLDPAGAAAFRGALEVDEATWLRGRGTALEHALGAVVYYTPRRHPLAQVMLRSLERVLRG